MKLPDKIKLFSLEYKIIYCDERIDVTLDRDTIRFTAHTYFDKQEIRILKKGRSIEQIWEDLFHELFHIVFSATTIENELNGEQEERFVQLCALGINDLFWNNIFPLKGDKKET